MRQFYTIFRREFWAYFNSPIAYVYIIVFLLITSGLFMTTFFLIERADMRSYFAMLPLVLAVFIPAVTMRLWAEERNLGTLSLLLSLPLKSYILVLGKFMAALVFYCISLACTGAIPVILAIIGDPDWGPIVTGYVGAALIGCLFLAAGIFISALFKDQIVAFILSILTCFTMTLLGNDFVAAFIDGWVGGLGQMLQKGLGVSYHFAAFERGLIDSSDVIFFLSLSVILLILNGFTLDSRIRLHSPRRFYIATAFLLTSGFMGNLIVSDLRPGRFDLTDGRIYTISPATVRILSKLRVPVQVDYYVSEEDKMPSALKSIRRDVEDKLSDLARLSPNFTYHIYNPAADADKLDELAKKGILPFQAQSIEQDSLDIKRIYSAISITYLDKKTEVIPHVVPQMLGDLEYQLVSNAYRMTLGESPKVSMLAPLEASDPRFQDPRVRRMMMQMGQTPPEMQDNYQATMQILRQEGYQVNRIALTEAEPLAEDTKTLIILQPGELSQRQIYEIQRFLAKGGNVLLAAQSYNFSFAPTQEGDLQVTPQKLPGNINQLLEPYGAQLDSGILMSENPETLNVNLPRRIGGFFNAMVSMPVKLPMQIKLTASDLNSNVSMTNRISSLLYLWGCALNIDRKAIAENQLQAAMLADSGPGVWTIPFKTTALVSADLKPEKDRQKSHVLAILLAGQFPDTFEGKDIPSWPQMETEPVEQPARQEEKPSEKAPAIQKKQGKLIIVGCSQMFANNAIGALNNSLFFQNMVDGLTLSEDLIGIRTKSQPVRLIEALSAGQKLFYRFIAIGLVPLVLATIGTARFVVRKRRRDQYEKSILTAVSGG